MTLEIHQVTNHPSTVLYHLGVSISFKWTSSKGERNGKELCDQLNFLCPSGPRLYRCWNAPCYVSYAMALPLKVVRWGT